MCIRDRYITKTYNATTFRKEKVKNKLQLQRDLGLQEDVYKRQVKD